jgi:hypothetical protein
VKIDDPACKLTPVLAAKHGLKFAVAYDENSLYVRAVVKDDAKFAPKASVKRNAGKADRVEVSLDLTGLARPQGDRAPRLLWTLQVGLPDVQTGVCPSNVSRPRWNRIDGVTVSHKKAGGAVAMTIQVPWKGIDCLPAKPGKAIGLDVAHVSHGSKGEVHCHRVWAGGGGWAILA